MLLWTTQYRLNDMIVQSQMRLVLLKAIRQGMTSTLKVVCRLAWAIWSYWYGCRERIFLNISKASNPPEIP